MDEQARPRAKAEPSSVGRGVRRLVDRQAQRRRVAHTPGRTRQGIVNGEVEWRRHHRSLVFSCVARAAWKQGEGGPRGGKEVEISQQGVGGSRRGRGTRARGQATCKRDGWMDGWMTAMRSVCAEGRMGPGRAGVCWRRDVEARELKVRDEAAYVLARTKYWYSPVAKLTNQGYTPFSTKVLPKSSQSTSGAPRTDGTCDGCRGEAISRQRQHCCPKVLLAPARLGEPVEG